MSSKHELIVASGWPPDAAPGLFYGWDAAGRPCLLQWATTPTSAGWRAIRFDGANMHGPMPALFARGEDTEHFVVRHAPVPEMALPTEQPS